ncbi:enoyl-CoA hydratase-related protein [Photobacterium sp. DNB23_23_1]|uniref:Enoyl-CoA hydratase-related protein n=1 Tax=Photobacterium pectinilyticum TaxID=2906793 RepID=A0ABT1N4J9_9GAMM|nr:enoyl-CoA hydratase-related protein [Photobacterium sp. ZSDE20]MCQ1059635.1 enoyl-CoA hydratase-related protein [Photobacterium sp. ZSDE20]MDD1827609.1 enoyl-CoA hydratase-related protein [Photobacterium sp. ZSDE20]
MNRITTEHGNSNLNIESKDVLFNIDSRGIATITLNRPDKKNAFDSRCIAILLNILQLSRADSKIRVMVLRANGSHFSAGADLNWMQSLADYSMEENIKDAEKLAELLHQLDTFPVPTIAVVQGAAFGGALGLICCCDIAIASQDCQFCLSEVKLGLAPATISPYVCRAMGPRQARRYMLTAELISAELAKELNLIHTMVPTTQSFDEHLQHFIRHLAKNSPNAVREAKVLCHMCESGTIDSSLRKKTSQIIAKLRVSPEGQEGLNAFLEKRKPNWMTEHD